MILSKQSKRCFPITLITQLIIDRKLCMFFEMLRICVTCGKIQMFWFLFESEFPKDFFKKTGQICGRMLMKKHPSFDRHFFPFNLGRSALNQLLHFEFAINTCRCFRHQHFRSMKNCSAKSTQMPQFFFRSVIWSGQDDYVAIEFHWTYW